MQFYKIHPSELTQDQISAWRMLRAASSWYESPFFAPEFSQIVGAVRKDAQTIFAQDDSGKIVGILPYQVSGFGLARPIGAPFCDYHAPILSKDAPAGLAAEMVNQAGAAVYVFSGLPEGAINLGDTKRGETQSFIADLTPGYDDYLEGQRAQHPKHFKKARRMWRQAEREYDGLSLTFHETSSDVLDELISWKRAQFEETGLHDVLAARWARDMLHACLASQNSDFSGVLTTLRAGPEKTLIAAELGLRSNNVLHGWISGYANAYANNSPGMLLQTGLLKAAVEAGVERADLGVGADHYKKYYASHLRPVSEGVIPANNVFGALRGECGQIWRKAETAPLGPASRIAGKFRRRLDNILAVEATFSGRAQGVLKALKR